MFNFERVIAHRGASAYAPENTFAAFEKAIAMGATWIEFDVMLSQDGGAFVFHDQTLGRTTNGKGEFGLVSSDYIKSLNAGSWFDRAYEKEKVPSLSDVIHWLTHKPVQACIEVKAYPGCTEATVVALLTHLNREWPMNKQLPLVSSFDVAALRLCRSMMPELGLSLLLRHWDEQCLKTAQELGCISIHLSRRIVTRERVQELKNAGYKVCVYTVNHREEAMAYFDWGVDSIFTDYPDLIL